MELWQVAVLAIVQGLTEFLPISSDGHLVVATALVGFNPTQAGLTINDLVVILHGGTLLSIFVYYRQAIRHVVVSDRRTMLLLVIATIPAVILGLPAKLFAEDLLGNVLFAGLLLPVTGLLLLFAKRRSAEVIPLASLSKRQAFLLGLAQAAAILPGISRSGCTITAAVRMGLSPTVAARFSFLMAIPVLMGACVLQAGLILTDTEKQASWSILAFGTVISFVVGIAAIHWLVRWLERGWLSFFAMWCIPFGVAVFIWQFWFPTAI